MKIMLYWHELMKIIWDFCKKWILKKGCDLDITIMTASAVSGSIKRAPLFAKGMCRLSSDISKHQIKKLPLLMRRRGGSYLQYCQNEEIGSIIGKKSCQTANILYPLIFAICYDQYIVTSPHNGHINSLSGS